MNQLIFAITGLAALIVSGCGGDKGLRAQGAADLQCPIEQTSAHEPVGYVGHAKGCGREMVYVWDRQKWVSPVGRAAFELDCPADKLTVTPLSDRTAGVSGCGHKAVYIIGPMLLDWVMNTESSSSERPKGE